MQPLSLYDFWLIQAFQEENQTQMTLKEIIGGFKSWRFSRGRAFDLTVAIVSIGLYEFVARPYYRPYIYSNGINDFHLADTIGNTLGTAATVFSFLFVFGRDAKTDGFIINTVTISVALYELAHPLLGKPIDPWDFGATLLSGVICHLIYRSFNRGPRTA
jgi:hypothetical protein